MTTLPGSNLAEALRTEAVPILYTNWRGETAVRRIAPIQSTQTYVTFWFGSNEWHPEPQWLLSATDVEKGAERCFALAGIKAWGAEAVAALTASSTDVEGLRAGIYLASKTTHAPRWRDMRAAGLPIISTWIDEAGKGETACFTDLWRRCVAEAAGARAVIVYREPDEVLKGAFVEVGAALAIGVPVFAVGCDEFSFVNHAGVTRCASLGDAVEQALAVLPRPAASNRVGEALDREAVARIVDPEAFEGLKKVESLLRKLWNEADAEKRDQYSARVDAAYNKTDRIRTLIGSPSPSPAPAVGQDGLREAVEGLAQRIFTADDRAQLVNWADLPEHTKADYRDDAAIRLAALAPAGRRAPEGFVQVPREPTEEVIETIVKGSRADVSYSDAEEVYRTIVETAPPQPQQPRAEGSGWQPDEVSPPEALYAWLLRHYEETNPTTGEGFRTEARALVSALADFIEREMPTPSLPASGEVL